MLIQNGALTKIEDNLQNNSENEELDIINLYKNRNIIDMVLREVSLCDSISDSRNNATDEQESDESAANSYISLFDLLSVKNGIIETPENRAEERIDSQEDVNSKESEAHKIITKNGSLKRSKRYLRNYVKKQGNKEEDDPQSKLQHSNSTVEGN